MSLTEGLRELVALLTERGSPIRGQLRPGLTERVLARTISPLRPCPDLVEFYGFADGQAPPNHRLAPRADLLPHRYALPVAEALEARTRQLAIAGMIKRLDFSVFELDCLPILETNAAGYAWSMGQGDDGLAAGRISTPKHSDPFGEVEPDLLTPVMRTIDGLRDGSLVAEPLGGIWDLEQAPAERRALMEVMFREGSLDCIVSSSFGWLGPALASFVELADACGTVTIVGYPRGAVQDNDDREPEQLAELVRLLNMFGVPTDEIVVETVEPSHRFSAHRVDLRVTFPRPAWADAP